MYGYAEVHEEAQIYGYAKVYDTANIHCNTEVYGDANIYGEAWVYGYVSIYENAHVYGNAHIYGNVDIYGNAQVYGCSSVCGKTIICENAHVYDAEIDDNELVHCPTWIRGNAEIKDNESHCGFNLSGPFISHIHAYRTKKNEVEITCEDFRGNMEEFEKEVEETYSGKISKEECNRIIEEIRTKLD